MHFLKNVNQILKADNFSFCSLLSSDNKFQIYIIEKYLYKKICSVFKINWGGKNMNKKITIVGFFVSIMLLAQIMVPPVTASPIDENYKINISKDDLQKLENAINNLKGSILYHPLKSIYDNSIIYYGDGDEVELKLSGIHDMLEYLAQTFPTLGGITNSLASSINDLIIEIICIIISYIVAIPFIVLKVIVQDIELAVTEFFNNVISHLVDIFRGGLIVGIAGLITDIKELIEAIKTIIPNSLEELEPYLIEAVEVALQSMIVSIGRTILDDYVMPRFGYISYTAEKIVNACVYTKKLVDDLNRKLPWIQSIFVDLPRVLVEFVKAEGLVAKISLFDDLNMAIFNAFLAAVKLYNNIGTVSQEITIIYNNMVDLYDYYYNETKPWEEPITVTGQIMNFDSDVVVCFDDPDQTDVVTVSPGGDGYFELEYVTKNKENPMVMHQFTVKATYGDISKTQNDWAYSDGEADVDFNFRKTKARLEPYNRLQILGAKLESLFAGFKMLFRQFTLGLNNLMKELQMSYTLTMC